MSTAPRLTIGLPVYNGEVYLSEALDALLGQTSTTSSSSSPTTPRPIAPRRSAANTRPAIGASTTFGIR